MRMIRIPIYNTDRPEQLMKSVYIPMDSVVKIDVQSGRVVLWRKDPQDDGLTQTIMTAYEWGRCTSHCLDSDETYDKIWDDASVTELYNPAEDHKPIKEGDDHEENN